MNNRRCGFVCGPGRYGSFNTWEVVAVVGVAVAIGFIAGQLVK